MAVDGIRELSAIERALVSGGAQAHSMDRIDVWGPWVPTQFPDFSDPYDQQHPENGGGGGGDDTSSSDPLDAFTVSGLGNDVDQLLNKSKTVETLFLKAKEMGFVILTTTTHSKTDLSTKTFYIKQYSNPADTLAQLVHELGHATFDKNWTKSMGRDAAINQGLFMEGEATLHTMAAQHELAAQGITMNLQGEKSNAPAYNAIYNDYVTGRISWDAAAQKIGEIYRYGEKIDVNGTTTTADDITYQQYYSDYWDSVINPPPASGTSGGSSTGTGSGTSGGDPRGPGGAQQQW